MPDPAGIPSGILAAYGLQDEAAALKDRVAKFTPDFIQSSPSVAASLAISAPAAAARALSLGQPSRGLTSRKSVSPKLAMARAAKPIFSPSCGSTRMMAGAATASAEPRVASLARLVLGTGSVARARLPPAALAFTIEARCYREAVARNGGGPPASLPFPRRRFRT